MFWRRRHHPGNAVDAAQRRLAALAEQLRGDQPEPPDREVQTTVGRHASRAEPSRRPGLTTHHVALLALVVGAVITVAAWAVTRAVPDPQPVQLSSEQGRVDQPPDAGAATGTVPTGAASAPAVDQVVVDVAGKVRRPGIVELPTGSRVVDAIDAAGGPRPGVDVSTLNLARVLVDGEQLVVGATAPVAAATPSDTPSTAPASVDLNTATLEQLDTLPGIGPVTAQAILDWRTDHGAFTSVDELMEVSGIGDAILTR